MITFDNDAEWGCLFPGIGVKMCGKEVDFYQRYKATFQPFLEEGSDLLQLDLTHSFLLSKSLQPNQLAGELFAYIFSCGCFKVFSDKGLVPKYLGGHSLGIYGTLVAAKSITFSNGLQFIVAAHDIGNKHSSTVSFQAVAIIGLKHEEILKECQDKEYHSIHLANHNNPTSGVYVGHSKETSSLLSWAESAGAIKTITLNSTIPYHNPLFMQESAADFQLYIETVEWSDPITPIISALDQKILTSAQEVCSMTGSNIATPIHWPATLLTLNKLGIDKIMECGVGISLSQHSRFIDNSPRHYNLRNMKRKLDY